MIEIGSAIDPGRRRIAQQNQDALSVVRPKLLNLELRPPLLIIADGMGGYEGGAVASQTVISSFTKAYLDARSGEAPLKTLQAGLSASLNAMQERAAQDPALSRMGSTVVAAIPKGHTINLLNVGDSRAYLISEKGVRQISFDHSLVGEQLRLGLISEAQVRTHPRRNVLSLAISAQHGEVNAFSGAFRWRPGERLVLCSDGLWGPVPESQVQAVVIEYPAQQAAEKLVDLANTNQGPDNIAVIVARFL